MSKLGKIWYLFLIAVIVIGIFGGIGYAAMCGAYVIVSCLVGCGVLLVPTVCDLWNSLTK